MAQYGDPEGTFSSIKTAAEPGDVTAYRTTPQFAVSVGKFAVMSLCTFGFYEPLALVYFLLHIGYRLPDPLWLISLLSFIPLLVVQRSVNELNRAVAPEAPRNASYSGLNVVGIVLGGLMLLLAILGTLLPPPGAQLPVPVST